MITICDLLNSNVCLDYFATFCLVKNKSFVTKKCLSLFAERQAGKLQNTTVKVIGSTEVGLRSIDSSSDPLLSRIVVKIFEKKF